MSPQLEVRGLTVRLSGRTLVTIDELVVSAGDLAVIIGGAGSGKTILAGALIGEHPYKGVVRVAGRPLTGPPSRRARSGLAASVRDDQRIAGCTVREALQLCSRSTRRADEALDRIPQLATRADLRSELLSGGEQQLLQTACAWCAAQPVLVLDSPTVGLADDAATTIRALAGQEAARGASVVWLDQDARAAPRAPAAELIRGRLTTSAGPTAEPGCSGSAT